MTPPQPQAYDESWRTPISHLAGFRAQRALPSQSQITTKFIVQWRLQQPYQHAPVFFGLALVRQSICGSGNPKFACWLSVGKAAAQLRSLFWFNFSGGSVRDFATVLWDLEISRIIARRCPSFTLMFHGQKHASCETPALAAGHNRKTIWCYDCSKWNVHKATNCQNLVVVVETGVVGVGVVAVAAAAAIAVPTYPSHSAENNLTRKCRS